MDSIHSYDVILMLVLMATLGLSAFFSSCETSFSSLSKIKLKNMEAKGKGGKRVRLALRLLDMYDKLLSSVLIGNTIVNVVSSALATLVCINLFGPSGVSIATLVITIAVLLFGEITPKTLAKESPETTAIMLAPLLRFFTVIFTPLNYLTGAWKKIIVKIFPVKIDRAVTEEELLTFVEEVRQEGGINRGEEQMIRQVIEFDDITAAEIVTPRIDVAAVDETSPPDLINRVFAETGFSRIPVFRENIDTITGVILLKDFHHEVINRGRKPAEIVKPVVFVTKTMKISELLRTLQKKQSHMAVLVDEFGGTLGIVTIEDILEELVGEIWDEHDEVIEPIKKNADGSYTVLGGAKLRDMLEFINNGIIPETGRETTTVANWVMENSGSLPRAGERFTWHNVEATVSRVQRHRVMEVIIKKAEDQP